MWVLEMLSAAEAKLSPFPRIMSVMTIDSSHKYLLACLACHRLNEKCANDIKLLRWIRNSWYTYPWDNKMQACRLNSGDERTPAFRFMGVCWHICN